MRPLLAHVFEPHRWPAGERCHVQKKYDGVRALYQNGHFQSRDGIPWDVKKLAHISSELRALFAPEIILDGELYHHGWALGRINSAVAVNSPDLTDETSQIVYHVFDVVDFTLPFDMRFSTSLKHKLNFCKNSYATETLEIKLQQEADDYYAKVVSEGFEGIMYRLGDCTYTQPKQVGGSGRTKFLSDQDNRVWHLLKRKDWKDDWFRCTNIEEGEGKNGGRVGALVFETLTGKTFRCGIGIDDTQRQAWFDQLDLVVGKSFHIKFRVYTADGIPFNPSILEYK